ncbi:Uncharacterised protein [Phocoenobacter uteri]|uniref:Uncharacterized protein n=1 Tax=Phocoenobacter uteri TaxID=146806 RepID=A0A379C9P5_9PAST|nr:YmfL family putative regulatory protein [Phocoenobacter uteri]MDG6880967.1 hypothetical protein [Phocoenobacter uteri]SUB58984.1 Uncharacterised protein [Phocoenobacter uteri]
MKKTILDMFKKINGGSSAVAGFLGMTEAELNNRLYQTKGQRFKDEELIAIEREFGVSDWSDEINRQLGKVSIVVPNSDQLDLVELSQAQLHERAVNGLFDATLEECLSDGVLTTAEQEKLRKLLHKAQSARLQAFEVTVSIFTQ